MTNMIQNAKDQAAALAMAAYKAAAADGTLPEAEVKTAPVEIPKDTANGDYTTTFALAAAKALGKPPRVIASFCYSPLRSVFFWWTLSSGTAPPPA